MRAFLPALAAIFLFSCSQKKESAHISYLNDNAIFNKDSLRNFLNTVSVRQADSSKAVFLKGIDLLKNGKQAEGAINAFIESLTIYPAANTYYELGNAFLQTKKWPSALQSFEMAESLDFSPLGSVLFKMASCYAEMDSTEKVLKNLHVFCRALASGC